MPILAMFLLMTGSHGWRARASLYVGGMDAQTTLFHVRIWSHLRILKIVGMLIGFFGTAMVMCMIRHPSSLTCPQTIRG